MGSPLVHGGGIVPHKKKHKRKLELIHRIATKLVQEWKELQYDDRLKEMHLTTLEERSEIDDRIAIYRQRNQMGELDNDNLSIREGQMGRHKKQRIYVNVKKDSFPQKAVDTGNGSRD